MCIYFVWFYTYFVAGNKRWLIVPTKICFTEQNLYSLVWKFTENLVGRTKYFLVVLFFRRQNFSQEWINQNECNGSVYNVILQWINVEEITFRVATWIIFAVLFWFHFQIVYFFLLILLVHFSSVKMATRVKTFLNIHAQER